MAELRRRIQAWVVRRWPLWAADRRLDKQCRCRELKRTLYRDEQLVGLVDTPELAAEIVETMNRVGRLLDEVRPVDSDRRRAAESGRGRSHRACRYCGHTDAEHGESLGGGEMVCAGCPCGLCGEPRDAQRRSEATPKKDLQPCPKCGFTDCTADRQEPAF